MSAEPGRTASRRAFEGPLLAGDFVATELPRMRERAQAGPASRVRHRLRAAWMRARAALGPASGLYAVLDVAAIPVLAALGYRTCDVDVDAANRRASGRATAGPAAVTVAGVLVTAWGDDLGSAWRASVRAGVRHGAPWTLCANGPRLRLVDAERSWARRFVEFDLEACALDVDAFAVLWAVVGPEALRPARESGRDAPASALDVLLERSDRHATRVCSSLQRGVHTALDLLSSELSRTGERGTSPAGAARRQALTVVFRILFLLYAEARTLVPVWHPLYRGSYSIETLRDGLARGAPPRGTWEALQAMARLAHAGCDVDSLRVNAFNGRLFAPADAPLAERARVPDEIARRVLIELAMTPPARGRSRRPIAYADLGVEQLGAVYERLIDHVPVDDTAAPQCDAGAPRATRQPPRADPGARKATSTFYTPRPITDYLVRRTLHPLVAAAAPEEILALRVVDPAMGSGAFLVSSCVFLAGAYEAALVRRGDVRPGDLTDADRTGFRRLVAQRCLYGVDRNTTAADLAKLSIWLTTLAADAPLTFLDHRLRVGDSLVGASPADLARQPAGPSRSARGRDTRLPLFDPDELETAWRSCVPVRLDLALAPDDTAAAVRAKERALCAISDAGTPLATWRRLADLWCAPWFWRGDLPPLRPAAFAALCDELRGRPGLLPRRERDRWLDAAGEAAERCRFFHWALEFPEVFVDADGVPRADAGFDAVVGNPPWDMVRRDGGSAPHRAGTRERAARLAGFVRESGLYGGASGAHDNCYQLFVERALSLLRHGGRLGLVVPWGLFADHGSAALRRRLFERCRCDAVVSFDNRRGLFPIHRSVKFALVTATTGGTTRAVAARLREADPAVLERIPDEGSPAGTFAVRIPVPWLRCVSGDHLAVPEITTPATLALVERIFRSAPALGASEGWSVTFGRELNATEDRGCFRASGEVPVIEGKHLSPFAVDATGASWFVTGQDASRRLGSAGAWLGPRLAYRDVASATNRLTVIAAILPARTVSTHTVFCLKTPLPAPAQWFLCAALNSYVFNFLARLWVTTHVTVALVARLPVPRPRLDDPALAEVAELARRLSRGNGDTSVAHARLQARVAHAYGLDSDGFAAILASFPLVAPDVRRAALRAFEQEAAPGWDSSAP